MFLFEFHKFSTSKNKVNPKVNSYQNPNNVIKGLQLDVFSP